MNKFEALEAFLKEAYKGRKYGHRDAYEYHLVGVAELAREKAREANLDPDFAYALGLAHDVYEDFDLPCLDTCAMLLPNNFDKDRFGWVIDEITNKYQTYYDYIRSIRDEYALLIKEADLEFNLLQDNAPKLRKYSLYLFALDYIKMKRILTNK